MTAENYSRLHWRAKSVSQAASTRISIDSATVKNGKGQETEALTTELNVTVNVKNTTGSPDDNDQSGSGTASGPPAPSVPVVPSKPETQEPGKTRQGSGRC